MQKSNETGTTASLLWKHRHGGATPHTHTHTHTHKTQPRSPIFFFPPQRGRPRSEQIIFFVYFNSRGVKCLTCLTTTTPSPYRSISVTCSHNAADKMFPLPDSGMPPNIITQPGGRDCLLADKMTSCRFGHLPRYVSGYSVAVYDH